MAFSPEFLDEIRARVGLADVIRARVRLTSKGREFQGLCPFHNEKTPSFTVNEQKGFYHCFGCGAHGGLFDFEMQSEGLDFREAVERLAAGAGLQVPSDTPEERDRARRRQSLHEVMEAAAAYFERMLRMPEGRNAMTYLRDRAITETAIRRFRLGYAPDGRAGLKTALAREGIAEDLLLEAGLVIDPDDRGRASYDRFRGRVMFPIDDRRGRVVGFGGRILGDGEPKYLNSPETPVFRKGHLLYGLPLAAKAARDHGGVVVVEGYMDVIALAQGGFENAVAPLGTALTEEQIRELWKLVDEPILCFDGDAAGGRAAVRAAERALPLLPAGKGLRFAELPPGDDPDTLIGREGGEAISRLLAGAVPLSAFLWRMETRGKAAETPEARAALWRRLKEHTQQIPDPDVRSQFQNAFRASLWPERRPDRRAERWTDRRPGRARNAPAAMSTAPGESPRARSIRMDPLSDAAKTLLAILINHPDFFHDVEDEIGAVGFARPSLDTLRQELIPVLSGSSSLDPEAVKTALSERGLSTSVNELFSDDLIRSNTFIKVEASRSEVMSAWRECFKALRDAAVPDEDQDETRRPGRDTSDADWQKWLARKRTMLNQGDD
jgi:DNA primase